MKKKLKQLNFKEIFKESSTRFAGIFSKSEKHISTEFIKSIKWWKC